LLQGVVVDTKVKLGQPPENLMAARPLCPPARIVRSCRRKAIICWLSSSTRLGTKRALSMNFAELLRKEWRERGHRTPGRRRDATTQHQRAASMPFRCFRRVLRQPNGRASTGARSRMQFESKRQPPHFSGEVVTRQVDMTRTSREQSPRTRFWTAVRSAEARREMIHVLVGS